MKTNEQIFEKIREAIALNKSARSKCNSVLTDVMSLIKHTEKELQNCLKEEYERGVNDGLLTATKLYKMGFNECVDIFGNSNIDYVLKNFTPLEMKGKIACYNEEKKNKEVHIGDVV